MSVRLGAIDRIKHCKEKFLYYNEYHYIALQTITDDDKTITDDE
ncbi:unnamed protein product [Brugia timori]|uniref:Ubiquitinyl hydrolase 1 n=1 Tax=Brugia timori TaxID=42155 RepID=A0A0R3Q364_9BILA|nr:unnamed protein product [Brugia timori]